MRQSHPKSMYRMWGRKPLKSLKAVLLLPFLVQTSVIVIVVGYLSFLHGQWAVNDLAAKLRTELTLRISEHVNYHLEKSTWVNAVTVNAIDLGLLDVENLRSHRRFFWKQMADFKDLKFIGLGTHRDEYVGFERVGNRLSFTMLDIVAQGIVEEWWVDDTGNLEQLRDSAYKYKPTSRPWYKSVVKHGQSTWSDVYLSYGPEKFLIVSANQPIYDQTGSLQGVATNSLSLSELSEFLGSLNISQNGKAFIVDSNGDLVATSTKEAPFRLEGDIPTQLPATQSINPLIKTTATHLSTEFSSWSNIKTKHLLNFNLEKQKFFVDVTPFSNGIGLNWLIVVVIPESDFMEKIQANNRTTAFLCIGALLVAVASGLRTSNWIVQPIKRTILAVDSISQGNWEHELHITSPVELKLLAKAVNRMALQLKDLFIKLEHNAYHDVLTGLPNRAALIKQLEYIRNKQDSHPLFALLFLDIDDFKIINDSLGHHSGDQLLVAVAQRIETALVPQASVMRIGGDEFTILIENINSSQDAVSFADVLSQHFRAPFSIEERSLHISISIGIAFYRNFEQSPIDLLRDADIAMYQAKSQGKARYEIFDTTMHIQAMERLQIGTDLRLGLERNEFELYYQPILSLDNQEVVGFEALIRWHHPATGKVSPETFIPVAEETGFIIPLGEWILEQACQQMLNWKHSENTHSLKFVSVNVSVKQLLSQDFTRVVQKILTKTGLPAHYLKLEVTESSLADNVELMDSQLQQLSQLGIFLGIDDFGTGYSSMSYLYQFPFTTLKIDRSFITHICDQDESFKIVKAIIALAHGLGMDLIAEGVEMQEQLQQLQILGCEMAQGYLFSKPLPACSWGLSARSEQPK